MPNCPYTPILMVNSATGYKYIWHTSPSAKATPRPCSALLWLYATTKQRAVQARGAGRQLPGRRSLLAQVRQPGTVLAP
jgi:hypothetical protein